MYTYNSEPSQLARGDLGALRYAPGTVGKLTMSPFHRRIAGFVKLDTREIWHSSPSGDSLIARPGDDLTSGHVGSDSSNT